MTAELLAQDDGDCLVLLYRLSQLLSSSLDLDKALTAIRGGRGVVMLRPAGGPRQVVDALQQAVQAFAGGVAPVKDLTFPVAGRVAPGVEAG